MPILDNIRDAEKIVSLAGTKSDRWWLSLLTILGMCVTGLMFYWHRQDQQDIKASYETIVKSNTEALIRVNITLERMDRGSK